MQEETVVILTGEFFGVECIRSITKKESFYPVRKGEQNAVIGSHAGLQPANVPQELSEA
jgi:hypothetical protein